MSKPVGSASFMTRKELESNMKLLQQNKATFEKNGSMGTYQEFLDIFATQKQLLDAGDKKPASLPGRATALKPAAGPSKPAVASRTLPPGMRLVPIKGDGHCAFRSVLTGVLGHTASTADVMRLRGQVRDELAKAPPAARAVLLATQPRGTTWEGYLKQVARTNHWADEAEIRITAELLGVELHIHDARTGRITTINENSGRVVHLQYTGNHYNLLVPSS